MRSYKREWTNHSFQNLVFGFGFTKIRASNLNYCTGRMGWMAHKKWKETKQQQGTAGTGNRLGCCLLPFHFLWAIRPVQDESGGRGPVDWVGCSTILPSWPAISAKSPSLYAKQNWAGIGTPRIPVITTKVQDHQIHTVHTRGCIIRGRQVI